jgi:hypothetical protein
MFLEKGNCDLAIRHYSLSSSVLAPPRLFVALFAAMVPSVLLRASAVNPLWALPSSMLNQQHCQVLKADDFCETRQIDEQ